ncbi:MAG: hypothetical protein NTV80_08335 [Verrucomicrobia bacterium]|nr:hypothetical protein [Verrucomicrobiota bacterium]
MAATTGAFFGNAFLAATTGFLAGVATFLSCGFLTFETILFAGATGFLALADGEIAFLAFTIGFEAFGLAVFFAAALTAFGGAFLAATFLATGFAFLVSALGAALACLALDLDVLLLLTGFSSSICEVLASLSPQLPRCGLLWRSTWGRDNKVSE